MSVEFDEFDPEDELEDLAGLSPEEYDKLVKELEDFNSSILSYLANTANYEIVPTETEDGHPLKEEHYKAIKKECAKIGAEILYSYNVGRNTIVVNPKSMKTIMLTEGEAH